MDLLSYTEQNFVDGQVQKAQHLNAMDHQIAENEKRLGTINQQIEVNEENYEERFSEMNQQIAQHGNKFDEINQRVTDLHKNLKAADSEKLGGLPASDYVTKNNIPENFSGLPEGGEAGQVLVKTKNDDEAWDYQGFSNIVPDEEEQDVFEDVAVMKMIADDSNKLGGKTSDAYALKEQIPTGVTKSVNGKTPDDDGNVRIEASDVGALPAGGTAKNSEKLGGVAANEYAKKTDIPEESDIDLLSMYPVGSIYMSVNETSPASLFGGTWEQMKDRFLLGVGGSYSAGATGGEATHTLTVDELPSISGGFAFNSSGGTVGIIAGESTSGVFSNGAKVANSGVPTKSSASDSVYRSLNMRFGSDQPHNNMPPYLAVYMWKRVA